MEHPIPAPKWSNPWIWSILDHPRDPRIGPTGRIRRRTSASDPAGKPPDPSRSDVLAPLGAPSGRFQRRSPVGIARTLVSVSKRTQKRSNKIRYLGCVKFDTSKTGHRIVVKNCRKCVKILPDLPGFLTTIGVKYAKTHGSRHLAWPMQYPGSSRTAQKRRGIDPHKGPNRAVCHGFRDDPVAWKWPMRSLAPSHTAL
jgi:hypothetical protein